MSVTVRLADTRHNKAMKNSYKDIINLPHPDSKTRPRMTIYNRAAQFSPFAALTGYEEAVKETARYTNEKAELSEYQIATLNDKLNIALEKKSSTPLLSITYFKPDIRKQGGEYITLTGVIRKIDEINHSLLLEDGVEIPLNLIYDIKGDVFEENF